MFLSPQACQQRRAQNERMMVPLPHHIEFVDSYAHKGGIEPGDYQVSPWSCLGEDLEREREGGGGGEG